MKNKFNVITWQEWKFFVWRILENDVSSFWETHDECIVNLKEALSLYLEDNTDDSYVDISSPHLEKLELTYA